MFCSKRTFYTFYIKKKNAKTFLNWIGAESVKSVSKTKHYFFDKI